MKEVVIVGPMERAKDYSQDAQIWCINYSYKKQGRCDYVFHMDPIDVEKEEFFVKDMNALGCLVVSTRAYKEIPNSVAYPLDKVVEFFGGVRYFTSTIAYAMALAIATKVDRITMPGLNYVNDGWEYASQKPCLDFWAGVAVGRGIQFKLPKESGLARPWIWDPDLYGYVDNKNNTLCYSTISASYRACMAYPKAFVNAESGDDVDVDWYEKTVLHERVVVMDALRKRMSWEVAPTPVNVRVATAADVERMKKPGAVL